MLIIDPISQGERIQFRAADLRRASRCPRGGCTRRRRRSLPGLCDGHNLMGNQLALLGDFFGSWRVWDAIRAVDYLVSRPDVDPGRIGVTGNSGGGTLSAYLTALEPRLSMAAPGCFICSYGANLENENPTDAEQNPPGILGERPGRGRPPALPRAAAHPDPRAARRLLRRPGGPAGVRGDAARARAPGFPGNGGMVLRSPRARLLAGEPGGHVPVLHEDRGSVAAMPSSRRSACSRPIGCTPRAGRPPAGVSSTSSATRPTASPGTRGTRRESRARTAGAPGARPGSAAKAARPTPRLPLPRESAASCPGTPAAKRVRRGVGARHPGHRDHLRARA